MGLIEGSTLDGLIPERGMPLEQLLDTAIPIADALVAAHAKGITHRDLKPSNVMVGDDGRVRVLDFGLAKLVEETNDPELTQLPTQALTEHGVVMGTVPYMSPEQIEGKPVDPRTDIFSIGVLLYEMATGKRPFEGDSSACPDVVHSQGHTTTDNESTGRAASTSGSGRSTLYREGSRPAVADRPGPAQRAHWATR